ncbi:MAG TPA: FAD-dependent oxidoreductase [Acidimicrobiales bacterium]|nr:FAD-dependent oxidoreductase [Acidimicrobiales bacterium]
MDVHRVVIVGGGVLGTMHALEACRRGWEVLHLEADAGPRRASVRNFGLVWVSGRAAGAELDLALRARSLWEQLAVHTPAVGFRPDGSLTVARHEGELALLAEAAARPDADRRGFALLDADGVRSVNPAVRGDILGGLSCTRDAVVEPGLVLGALRVTLEATGRYTWIPRRRVVDVETASGGAEVAVDHLGGRHEGTVVLLCIGDRLSGLGGRIGASLAAAPLRRCRLQMMQTAPTGERLTTALADGDSLRYYPAFDLPGRGGLPPPTPTTDEWGLQLLLVQRAAGGLTIGDTHTYDEPFDFAVEEHLYDDLAARAEAVLGWPLPPVVRRWAGVYTGTTDDRTCYRSTVDTGVVVVTGPAGRGMTLSPAIAEETWEELIR